MSTVASHAGFTPVETKSRVTQILVALEILAVFTGVLLYIWRWQYSHPLCWIPMLIFVIASQFAHRDSWRDLGLTTHELRQSAWIILPAALAILIPVVVYGVAEGILLPSIAGWKSLRYFGGYLVWCVFQQYLTQSFFHTRLMRVIENRHASSALIGVMFGAAHIPNPILMIVTALGGFVFAEVFARHRNIWALALVQAVCGALLTALVPASLIHNMRVGPGYFFFGQR